VDLLKLGELAVAEKQVERLSKRIGAERVAERDAEVAAFQERPLVERCAGVPKGVVAPPADLVAVVMADAGMLQLRTPEEEETRPDILPFPSTSVTASAGDLLSSAARSAAGDDRTLPVATGAAAAPVEAATSAAVPGADPAPPEEEEPRPSGRHWHEDKVGLVLTMKSQVQATDPCPQIPEHFIDPQRITKLVRGLKKRVALGEDGLEEPNHSETSAEAALETVAYEAPQLQSRKVVASRKSWPLFGPILAAAAWSMGFAQAQRKAFVGDGASAIWKLWKSRFSAYVPVLDFIHALSYVFAAAMAVGGDAVRGWSLYVEWIQWVWQGQVSKVLTQLQQWQQEQGESAAGNGPGCVVQRALTYFTHHQDKMHYDEYRRQGMPLVSSLMESMVKQIGRRVKGTEKFWGEEGAEAILQLRADYLSDDEVMEDFWQRRQATASGQRNYRKVS
jgi:hypothetical protein